MLHNISVMFRKASLVIVCVAVGLWIVAEMMGGLTSKTGPKQPMPEQRRSFATFAAIGFPGSLWALVRTSRGKQRKLWEE